MMIKAELITYDADRRQPDGSVPIIETVEVVRCRDCKFFGEDELGAYCGLFDFEDVDEERQREGFCSWAKRRDA